MVTPVVGVAAEEVVETEVVAAEAVVVVKVARVAKETRQAKPLVRPPDIQEPSIRIFQPETGRGVGCTSNLDEMPSSQSPVGRIISFRIKAWYPNYFKASFLRHIQH